MTAIIRHYALFGNPVAHSLSPLMHNAAYEAMGIAAHYEAHLVERLETAVRMIRERPIAGVSVTLPVKEAMMTFLDSVDEDVRAIGAVNTITNEDGRLRGSNTDWKGLAAALRERLSLEGKTVAILGAGGAARAAVYGILHERGIPVIFSRNPEKGESLARRFRCDARPLEDLGTIQAEILVNTTPVGMHPMERETPAERHHLARFRWVMDTVYTPLETRLLREAKSEGCRVITGLPMFVCQGAEQIRIWTGLEPPVALMEWVVKKALTNGRVEGRGKGGTEMPERKR
jgi:shikimate dehydrogenase